MLLGVVRSGLVESRHPVTVAAVDAAGTIVFRSGGDQDTVFFLRSAAKPIQVAVSQRCGAALAPEQLAVGAGSHGGQPVHVALVEAMLASAGLECSHLLCPPVRPASESARRRAAAAGVGPRRVFHNCSGKHAAMLRACAARGWPLDYPRPSHPLQQEILTEVADSTGEDAGPVGVDGCGVPTFRGTAVGLARVYARLAADPGLTAVADAMARFAPLTSDGDRAEAELARWCHAVVKGGAQGCLGLAWRGGIGIGVKCWTGDGEAAAAAAAAAARRLGLLSEHGWEMLAGVAHPLVEGGGRPVGRLEVLEATA